MLTSVSQCETINPFYSFKVACSADDLISNTRTVSKWWLSTCGRFVSHTKQLIVNAGWQHTGRVPHPNYVDPECCVANVYHQFRCMYWGHLGHFHRAVSHLKWYKIVCMIYFICIFSQMTSIDMFPRIWNLEFPDISYGVLLRVEHRTSRFSCLCMSMLTPNSVGNM